MLRAGRGGKNPIPSGRGWGVNLQPRWVSGAGEKWGVGGGVSKNRP